MSCMIEGLANRCPLTVVTLEIKKNYLAFQYNFEEFQDTSPAALLHNYRGYTHPFGCWLAFPNMINAIHFL